MKNNFLNYKYSGFFIALLITLLVLLFHFYFNEIAGFKTHPFSLFLTILIFTIFILKVVIKATCQFRLYHGQLFFLAIILSFFSGIFFYFSGNFFNLFLPLTAVLITASFAAFLIMEKIDTQLKRSVEFNLSTENKTASMITYDEQNNEYLFPVNVQYLQVGDLNSIHEGEVVVADTKILSGEGMVEIPLFPNNLPVIKKPNDIIVSGSRVTKGKFKGYVIATAENSFQNRLFNAINLEKLNILNESPSRNNLNRIIVSSLFLIIIVFFVINYFSGVEISENLLRLISCLIIATPAMFLFFQPFLKLRTINEGLKNGIFFRAALFNHLIRKPKKILFEPEGIFTNGKLSIQKFSIISNTLSETDFKGIVFSLVKFSGHKIANTIKKEWKQNPAFKLLSQTFDSKGFYAKDTFNNNYKAVLISTSQTGSDTIHDLTVFKNDFVLGWIDFEDEIKPEATTIVDYFGTQQIKPVLLKSEINWYNEQLATKLKICLSKTINFPVDRESKSIIVHNIDSKNISPNGLDIFISVGEAANAFHADAKIILFEKSIRNIPETWKILNKYRLLFLGNLAIAISWNIIFLFLAGFGFLHPVAAILLMFFWIFIGFIQFRRLKKTSGKKV